MSDHLLTALIFKINILSTKCSCLGKWHHKSKVTSIQLLQACNEGNNETKTTRKESICHFSHSHMQRCKIHNINKKSSQWFVLGHLYFKVIFEYILIMFSSLKFSK